MSKQDCVLVDDLERGNDFAGDGIGKIKQWTERKNIMDILLVIYIIAGYWAAGKTIYANKIRIGTFANLIVSRLVVAIFLGWILIPWAIIKK